MQKLIRVTTIPLSLEKLLEDQLTFMNDHYEIIAVSSEKERLTEFGKNNRVRTYHIELTRHITPLKDLKALWKMYRFLKREQPAIVHTHTPKAGLIGMLAARLANVRFRLHTIAGLPLMETTGMKRKVLEFVERLTYYCATNIYPNSYGLKEIIIAKKLCRNKDKIKVIGNGSSNGIDTSYFDNSIIINKTKDSLKESLGVNKDDFVFIFVGRLVGDKGINELVEAYLEIDIAYNHEYKSKLLLVGPLEPDLDPLKKETLSAIESNHNIILAGYQKDVRPYFSISDVLVFPSYREGFPNVVMQAGSMGLPAIVSDINGCNELIREYENGLIVPSKDKVTLKEAMVKLLTDSKLVAELSQNARAVIVEKYERRFFWDSLLKEYMAIKAGKL